MGEIVPFRRTRGKTISPEGDFTGILKDVVEIGRESLGAEVNGVFLMNVDFESMLKAKIGSFIIEHKLITADLFRCGLYVAHLLSETLSREIGSCYVTDYYIQGFERGDPAILQQGADLCCLLCILFEERRTWRMMKKGDYAKMGMQLYSLYYAKTKRPIGWCMSRNFEPITAITRKCIEGLDREH
ncbi:MAG: hypothetical protein AB1805_06620 [Nitrospirota bacterium]